MMCPVFLFIRMFFSKNLRTDIVAVGVKPTISGYEPDEHGLLAISANLLYHTLDKFSIIKYKTEAFGYEKTANGKGKFNHVGRRLQQVFRQLSRTKFTRRYYQSIDICNAKCLYGKRNNKILSF